MGNVTRLSGAILAETQGRYFLVGNLKGPCNFENNGFRDPGEIDPLKHPYIELEPTRIILREGVCIHIPIEGEQLPQMLVRLFVIERNGSISQRLWTLVTENSEVKDSMIDASWLSALPDVVWEAVRDSVLRCA